METRIGKDGSGVLNCGCILIVLIFNFLVGGWSVNYLMLTFLEKAIPIFWAGVIGLFVGELSVPAALIVAILKYFGVL